MSNTVTLPFIDFEIPLNVVILGLAGLTYALIAVGLTLVYRTSRCSTSPPARWGRSRRC